VNARDQGRRSGGARFRLKLLLAMMVVIATITALGLYIEQRNLAANATRNLQQQFQSELESLHNIQEVRHAALAERCRALVRKPRIHAALEDNALDLLYPSAKDEMRDIMEDAQAAVKRPNVLRGEFYRFLDGQGAVIPAPNPQDAGDIGPESESKLALRSVPRDLQLGYLPKASPADESVSEVITMPILSTETGEVIAALAIGFRPVQLGGKRAAAEMKSGIWLNNRLYLAALSEPARNIIGNEITTALASGDHGEDRANVTVDGVPHLLFFKRLNVGSAYPLACEVCLFPLTDLRARQRQVRWQILTGGALMLLAGFVASHFVSGRLSKPVEKLAHDRERAETALEQTSVELQRSARFSADASHQLKTPVAVLRAGLEELLSRENIGGDAREEISQLVHQTYRLNGVIEDLLLLSRMDAGRLQVAADPVDLSALVEAELDDLSAHSEDLELVIDADVPTGLRIAGEKRYATMIVRNLLENARKYNRRGGCIRVKARRENGDLLLTIANTGGGIPARAQEHIFDRFHRGSAGENIPGHGLGLNLARELARLHGGDVRLIASEGNWTEFEIRFRALEEDVEHS
jgi:signal transduction histidine kinase